jgi:hypothetical protein
MKTILLASALMISGVAYAQADPRDAGQPIGSGATLQPGTTMGERDTMGPAPAAPTASTTGTMSSGTMSSGTMSTDTSMGSSSTMGTTGSGTVTTVQEGGNMSAAPASTGPYPRCSRTITDHCQQSSARESDTKGGRPARRRR